MKTRNIFAMFLALPLLAGFVGCKSDEETNAKPAKETLIVEDGKTVEMRSGDETRTVSITADCAWSMEVESANNDFGSKLSVQPARGNGNGTLVITTDQNTGVQPREATIILTTDGGLKQRIKLRQTSGDPAISISERTMEYAAIPASAQTLTITSNSAWTATLPTGVSWVHLDKTSGSTGSTVINVTADEIQDDVARSANITIVYGSSSAQVKVIQQPKTNISLSVDRSELYFSSWSEQNYEWEREHGNEPYMQEQYEMVNVTCNAAWKVYIPSSSSSWVWAEPQQGTGNGQFRVMCSPWMESTSGRLTMVIVVAGSQNPQQCDILVQQGAGSPEPTPQPQYSLTVGDLTSMYVGNISADFRFSFVCTQSVGDYGLVYSSNNSMPTVADSEMVTKGHGSTSGTVLAWLENLQPNTTYYVRAFVNGNNGAQYSPNVVTIHTSSSQVEPGESDNPDPTLAPRR